MARRSHRGVGSNQYMDRAPSPSDDEALAAQIRDMHTRIPTAETDSAIAGEFLRRRPLPALVGEMSEVLDRHLSQFTGRSSTNEREMLSGATQLARAEDALYQQHQNVYGAELIQAVYWSKTASTDPRVRAEIEEPHSLARVLTQGYATLMQDATEGSNSQLNADELTTLLASLSRNEERWNGNEPSEEMNGGTPSLAHRHAALSVVCSRSSGSDSERQELLLVQQQLNERRVDRIGL